jgi:hypothetical protein
MTWDYFYDEVYGGLGDPDGLQGIYQQALRNTKVHMQTISQRVLKIVR